MKTSSLTELPSIYQAPKTLAQRSITLSQRAMGEDEEV
ncbi:unnamed protein product [Brassica oleracea var. botrytis]